MIPLPPDTKTIAEMVPEEYYCGYMGKWHLGDDVIRQHGFDVWKTTEDTHMRAYTKREYRNVLSAYHEYLVSQGYEPSIERNGVRVFGSDQHYELPEEHQMGSYLYACV